MVIRFFFVQHVYTELFDLRDHFLMTSAFFGDSTAPTHLCYHVMSFFRILGHLSSFVIFKTYIHSVWYNHARKMPRWWKWLMVYVKTKDRSCHSENGLKKKGHGMMRGILETVKTKPRQSENSEKKLKKKVMTFWKQSKVVMGKLKTGKMFEKPVKSWSINCRFCETQCSTYLVVRKTSLRGFFLCVKKQNKELECLSWHFGESQKTKSCFNIGILETVEN